MTQSNYAFEKNHFLEISHWSYDEVITLIQRALSFKKGTNYPSYSEETVAHLFYENSTRTRVSFELAAKKLAMTVVNLEVTNSSESKGEIIEDTVKTLAAMGINQFVIRHVTDRMPHRLAEACGKNVHIINAGDGMHAHPSQAMLDLMTIIERKPNLSQLKIAVVGNIRHSRVANSLQSICGLLGVGQLVVIAPPIWQPTSMPYGSVTSSLREGIEEADVVICLRVQKERLQDSEQLDLISYHHDYAITLESLRYAKKEAIVMHPGPINRGVEMDAEVADGAQSVILQQVRNGVFMRMAILERMIRG